MKIYDENNNLVNTELLEKPEQDIVKKYIEKNDVVLAIPSSGIHSNGYSLVRSILKKNKLPINLKKEILRPTKIYSKEILKLTNKNLINAAANITGGGLIDNLLRSVPSNFTLNIDLSKIKILKIFKWLKSNNLSDNEMLRTFNCGVGFCLVINPKNLNEINKFFSKSYQPYEIGKIINRHTKIKINGKINWL